MPSIDTLHAALTAITGPATETSAKKTGGSDDFEKLMKKAVTPDGKTPPEVTLKKLLQHVIVPAAAKNRAPGLSADLTAATGDENLTAKAAKTAASLEKKTTLAKTALSAADPSNNLTPSPFFTTPPVDVVLPPVAPFLFPAAGNLSTASVPGKNAPADLGETAAVNPVLPLAGSGQGTRVKNSQLNLSVAEPPSAVPISGSISSAPPNSAPAATEISVNPGAATRRKESLKALAGPPVLMPDATENFLPDKVLHNEKTDLPARNADAENPLPEKAAELLAGATALKADNTLVSPPVGSSQPVLVSLTTSKQISAFSAVVVETNQTVPSAANDIPASTPNGTAGSAPISATKLPAVETRGQERSATVASGYNFPANSPIKNGAAISSSPSVASEKNPNPNQSSNQVPAPTPDLPATATTVATGLPDSRALEMEASQSNAAGSGEANASSPEPLAASEKSDLRVTSISGVLAKNSGTGVASTVPVMKNSDKVDFFAGSDGQKLPGEAFFRSAASDLRSVAVDISSAANSSLKSAPDLALTYSGAYNGGNSSPTADVPTQLNVVAQPAVSMSLKTAEQTHELVAQHALRLVETKADAMSVVLKPDAGTELALQLRQRDGTVEATAVLTAGDHQLLNQHWADLQSRLDLRGVKLGPLGGENNFGSTGFSSSGGGQQRSAARDEAADQASAFAEFAVMAGGATARRAPVLQGWESWA